MRFAAFILGLSTALCARGALSGPYAPAADQPGSTAVAFDDSRIVAWASGATDFAPGRTDISTPGSPTVSWGTGTDATEAADAHSSDSFAVVSLGDGGSITLTFAKPFGNGPGPDLAVFENGFSDSFLELAFVEVSSDGTTFHRFPAISLTQTTTQVGAFGALDPRDLYNLAGKYRRGFGTPFDLAELAGMAELDIGNVTHVRIVDVVGSLQSSYRTRDSRGQTINDPWRTDFETGGFDLDAIAVLHIPEPATAALSLWGLGLLLSARRRRQ